MRPTARPIFSIFFTIILLGCKKQAVGPYSEQNDPILDAWVASPVTLDDVLATQTLPPKYLSPELFKGYYEESFEVRSFVPCDSTEMTGYGHGYWIDSDWQSEFSIRYSELSPIMNTDPGQGSAPGQIVYVEFVGQQVNPAYGVVVQGGRYGHMGQYDGEVFVLELIAMTPIQEQKCIAE